MIVRSTGLRSPYWRHWAAHPGEPPTDFSWIHGEIEIWQRTVSDGVPLRASVGLTTSDENQPWVLAALNDGGRCPGCGSVVSQVMTSVGSNRWGNRSGSWRVRDICGCDCTVPACGASYEYTRRKQ